MFNPAIVQDRILALQDKYDNAVAVMGGAYWASQEVHSEKPNFDKFLDYLASMMHQHAFFGWHESLPQAMRTFCKLAMVDPALIESYLGVKFEEVCANA